MIIEVISSSNHVSFVFFAIVTCTVNARKVTIKGERGQVTKDFSHVACELKKMNQTSKKRSGVFVRIRIWFGGTKQSCAVNTLKSHINNMITGVTEVSQEAALLWLCLTRPFHLRNRVTRPFSNAV